MKRKRKGVRRTHKTKKLQDGPESLPSRQEAGTFEALNQASGMSTPSIQQAEIEDVSSQS